MDVPTEIYYRREGYFVANLGVNSTPILIVMSEETLLFADGW